MFMFPVSWIQLESGEQILGRRMTSLQWSARFCQAQGHDLRAVRQGDALMHLHTLDVLFSQVFLSGSRSEVSQSGSPDPLRQRFRGRLMLSQLPSQNGSPLPRQGDESLIPPSARHIPSSAKPKSRGRVWNPRRAGSRVRQVGGSIATAKPSRGQVLQKQWRHHAVRFCSSSNGAITRLVLRQQWRHHASGSAAAVAPSRGEVLQQRDAPPLIVVLVHVDQQLDRLVPHRLLQRLCVNKQTRAR